MMDEQAMKWLAGAAGAAAVGTAAMMVLGGRQKPRHSREVRRMAHMVSRKAGEAVLGADNVLNGILKNF